MIKLNKLASAFATFAAAIAITSAAGAADEQMMSSELIEKIAKNIPELVEDKGNNTTRSGNARMKCFVDTPAFDQFTYNICFSVGSAQTTSALFRIDNVPSNFTILWSDSRCNSSSRDCSLPISWYQTINLSATVLNNSNNTFTTTSTIASYEGFF